VDKVKNDDDSKDSRRKLFKGNECEYSLFIFSQNNAFRIFLKKVIKKKILTYSILIIIILFIIRVIA